MRMPADHRDIPFEEELLYAALAQLVRRNELLWKRLALTEDMLAQVLLTTGRVTVTPLTMLNFERERTVINRDDNFDGGMTISATVQPEGERNGDT